ncbi:MAG: adenylate kinase [Flavobacteriales bacterium]
MNKTVQYLDHTFQEFISEKELKEIVSSVATHIEKDLSGKRPLFIGILNGCFRFLNDLFGHFSMECEVEFVKLSSYESTESTGEITELIGLRDSLEGRTVLIIEDIIDTGLTITNVVNDIMAMNPAEVKVATLFLKPDIYKGALVPDYVGLEVAPEFIIGYGLDVDGLGRNLNSIYKKIESVSLQPSKKKEMLNIVLFGPPGCGKGTQSAILKEKYGLVHISTGDVFRGLDPESDLAKLAKSYADKGNLVPDEITIKILQSEVKKYPDARGVIYDGFPRTSAQAEALDKFLVSKGGSVTCMLELVVEEQELRTRLKGRAIDSGRPDDADPEVIQNRIDVYNAQTAPVAAFYKDQGKHSSVNGLGKIEEVSERLFASLDRVTA